jgi:uncharacterized membrane protein YfcA
MAFGAALAGAAASSRLVKLADLDLRIVISLAVGSVPGVLVAAFIVKEMPMEMLRWLVFVVVVYAAAVMVHAAAKGRREGHAEPATAPLAPEAEAGA